MKKYLLIAGVSALALVMTGCASTGGGGGGTPPEPWAYNAVQITQSNGNITLTPTQASVTVAATGDDTATGTFNIGGQQYQMTGYAFQTPGALEAIHSGLTDPLAAQLGHNPSAWEGDYYTAYELEENPGYMDGNTWVPGSGAYGVVAEGQYVQFGMLIPDGASSEVNNGYVFFDGTTPQVLPQQTANYTGEWLIGTTNEVNASSSWDQPDSWNCPDFCGGSYAFNEGASGIFAGSVNFEAGSWQFDLAGINQDGFYYPEDATNPVIPGMVTGTASGTLSGSALNGTMTTAGGFTSSNTVTGQLFGPAAQEVAGFIQGSSESGFDTYGYLIGHQ